MSKLPDVLQDYLFHYNIYTQYWSCFKREDSVSYFNGTLKTECIKSRHFGDLVKHFIILEKNNEGGELI